jgi:hypothetical protein
MKTPNTKLVAATAMALAILGTSLAISPSVASAEEGDRCGGRETPVCREVETCAGAVGTKICSTESYYFPSAS